MAEPFSVTVGVIGLLSNLFKVYTTVRQASRDWSEADLDLSKLDIRMRVAVAAANHNLRELEPSSSYSDGGAGLNAEAKEIRARCAKVLKTLLRRCETEMVSLEDRVGSPMDARQRMDWITSLKRVLEKCTTDLQKWNEDTERVLQLGIRWAYPPTSSSQESTSPTPDALWLETLSRMTVARGTHFNDQAKSDSLWINPDDLEFEETEASTTRPFLARVNLGFAQPPKLKLRPRRFGHRVREGHEKEPIMVEFREYYQNLSAERPGEYAAMRSGIMGLAQMLNCANSNNEHEESVSFPSVPLIGFSELSKSTPPCFLLVYNWSAEMKSLFQIIAETSNQKPPVADRLKLASDLGKSLFAFHTTGYVHGLLNPDNIFLSSSNFQSTRPLLAGFDISRSIANNTNKLDVKDLDARLYLHPDRLDRGQEKDANYAPYDVYSLGIIWLEIGLWLPLRKLKGMGREKSDQKRRDIIFEAFRYEEDMKKEMGSAYVQAVEYCLRGIFSRGGPTSKSPFPARFISAFEEPNASDAVAMLPTMGNRVNTL